MARMEPIEYVVYLLSRREYSEKEIRDKLLKRDHTQEEIEKTINTLKQKKYISNERFCSSFIKMKSSKFGNKYLLHQLAVNHKIDSETLEKVLDEMPDEEERILDIVYKKYHNRDLNIPKEKQRVFQYLCSKGFNINSINDALKTIKNNM